MNKYQKIYPNTPISLPQQTVDEIYRRQQRIYWEADFINRCIERREDEIGIRNFNYETLADDAALLDAAYEIYQKKEDCGIAYNATLDAVIDDMESGISKGLYQKAADQPEPEKIILLMDEKELLQVLCQTPDTSVVIAELDCFTMDEATHDAMLEQISAIPGFYPANLTEAAHYSDVLSSMQKGRKPAPKPRVAIVIEGGIISAVLSSDPNIQIEITELDEDYATSEQRDAVYLELQNDPDLKSCDHILSVPGFGEEAESEEDE